MLTKDDWLRHRAKRREKQRAASFGRAARMHKLRMEQRVPRQQELLRELPGVDDLVEYEARFNYVWPKHNAVVVCVYDATKFGLTKMQQILRAHPHAILGKQLVRNPSYMAPDDLLQEMGLHV